MQRAWREVITLGACLVSQQSEYLPAGHDFCEFLPSLVAVIIVVSWLYSRTETSDIMWSRKRISNCTFLKLLLSLTSTSHYQPHLLWRVLVSGLITLTFFYLFFCAHLSKLFLVPLSLGIFSVFVRARELLLWHPAICTTSFSTIIRVISIPAPVRWYEGMSRVWCCVLSGIGRC